MNRKYSAILALAALVALFMVSFASCDRDRPEPEGQIAVKLRADIQPASNLKVANDNWEAGDKAGLYMKKTDQPLTTAGAVYGNCSNVQMNIVDNMLTATPPVLYPETGNVDFVAYYPYNASVDADFTIPVNMAGQETGLPAETLYANNVTNQAPTPTAVPLYFRYSLAKLELKVSGGVNSPLIAADFAGMTVRVDGLYTQAKLQLIDGTITDRQNVQPITLHRKGSGATWATFEALVLPTTVATKVTFVFNVGGESYRYETDGAYNAATCYELNFALDFPPAPDRKATLLNAGIIPRTVNSQSFSVNIPARGVTLNRSTALLLVGKTQTLDATVASTGDANKTVYWTSSNELIATVTSAGEVTAVAPGTAIITVATDDGNTATCIVTVAATGITMTTNDMTFYFAFSMSAGAGKIIIDWGDGTLKETDNISSGELVFGHSYPYPPMSDYTMTITGNNIVSFSCQGYGYFPFIEDFNLPSLKNSSPDIHKLKVLDVSSNPALKKLNCNNNVITTLDLSHNTELTYLNCNNNRLRYLDLSHHTKLTYLSCLFNLLENLDVSHNIELIVLDCAHNRLTSLDVSNNNELRDLNCSYNYSLATLDVSRNTLLENLFCCYNGLTSLDVSRNYALIYLQCFNNGIKVLDFSSNIMLKGVWCSDNQLATSALNGMFRTLHDNTENGDYYLYVGGNPGASDCEARIAKDKGWDVTR